MTLSVSIPDASPPICMPAIATRLLVERSAGDHVERLRWRDGAQHVALQVPHLDDHSVRRFVAREVQLALLRAQLVVAAAGRPPLLATLSRGSGGARGVLFVSG